MDQTEAKGAVAMMITAVETGITMIGGGEFHSLTNLTALTLLHDKGLVSFFERDGAFHHLPIPIDSLT